MEEDTGKKCNFRFVVGLEGCAWSHCGGRLGQQACEWHVSHYSSPPGRWGRGISSPAHPSPTTVDYFPSGISSLCDIAFSQFRCWRLWHLLGYRIGPPPRLQAWSLLRYCVAEPAAGWTPAETLFAPDMPASSPATTQSTLSKHHHSANIESFFHITDSWNFGKNMSY